MEARKLHVSKERLDQMQESRITPSTIPQPRYRLPDGLRFEQRHKRVTLYFENPVYEDIEILRAKGAIPNLTALVNSALKSYLESHFKPAPLVPRNQQM